MREKTIKNFKLNAEMLGKASYFLPRAVQPWHRSDVQMRIEQFCLGGAKITATDRHRVIRFIDPGSDYSGPALSLINQGYPLSKFTKECRKTKSSIEEAIKGIDIKDNDIILITGSLYLAGEVLNLN